MSAEAARRAPQLTLRDMVDRYLALGRKFGRPVPLSSFNLTPLETETLFNIFDEDYHLSRFLHFSNREGKSYIISGALATHIAIDAAIRTIL